MTDQYAVFGNPIAHSKSPLIHAAFARQTGQDLSYQALLAPLDGFSAAVHDFMLAGGRGANVTVPFKLDAFRMAQTLTDRAKKAEAVNTLCFDSGNITGDNTDGAGLVHDLLDNQNCAIAGKHILLMGAGGAARGVIQPLLAESPASLTVVNRTVEKAEALEAHFDGIRTSSYAGLNGHQFDIIINATSSSLSDELPPLPPCVFASGSIAYDMMSKST